MAFEHWYCEKCKGENTVQHRKDDSVFHVLNLIATQHGKRSMKCANENGLKFVRIGFPEQREPKP